MLWHVSTSDRIIDGPTTKNPQIGELYIHKDTSSHSEQVWIYLGRSEGWRDISGEYSANAGTVEHPRIPDRVLTRRDDNGEPSYVLKKTFASKQKIREKAQRGV